MANLLQLTLLTSQSQKAKLRRCICSAFVFFIFTLFSQYYSQMSLAVFQVPDNLILFFHVRKLPLNEFQGNHYPWTWQNKTKIVTLDEVESWVPSKIGDDRKKASADAGVARKKEQRLTIMLHRNFMEHWPFFSHKFNLSRGEKAKTE